ncbi:polysaccharide deacetylase family protein [Methanocella arvoryzae]|uniref:NodB homology domain-containing protein n=1 Tax=Methanocella arvoryzae (strain DSM 22066 / NBRC 105507 / MRE50) TaxID=351160 RepID=Q0W7C9_METAR|nr:polysaccharide deacetylase family protein [Methanocella arvoryzae]CAJ35714.1 conserved hypothetical protein [Methanocella arvoryzae MRE50]
MACHVSEVLRHNRELWDQFSFKGISTLNQEYGHVRNVIGDRFLTRPYMSEYLRREGFSLEYPDGKGFAVCLTHDVDEIYPPLRHTALSSASSLTRGDLEGMKKHLLWRLKGKKYSPYINFREIMEIERRYGATSSFYFLATDKDVLRFRYDIEDLEGELGIVADGGCEVGLHGGYYAFDSPEKISEEKRRLEKVFNGKVTGYRNHYLRFRLPETWEYLRQAGFRYDTTIGNNRIAGFKNGLCHPYRPYDAIKNREIDIVELPLTLSDFTLMNTRVPFSRKWEIAKSLIDSAEKCGGVLTVLWHSDAFNNSHLSGWVKFYEKILKYCQSRNAWMASGREISGWVEDKI